MSESKRRLLQSAAQLRPALPLASVACALLALWVAFSAGQQWVDAARTTSLQEARDIAVQGTSRALDNEFQRLEQGLTSTPVQAALGRGDWAGAAAELQAKWANAEHVEVLPPDLQEAYAGLPESGFGRLAVAEAAVAEHKPIVRVGNDGAGKGGKAKLLFAAPARVGDRMVAVAVIRLPITSLELALAAGSLRSDNYLALRQDNQTITERGDKRLADSAESLATKIKDSDLRIAAGVPDTTQGILGLSAIPGFVVALLLAALALTAWLAHRRGWGLAVADAGADDEPTLAQAVQQIPAEQARPTVVVADARRRGPVQIDRGIFRAYDIRGVVGKTLDIGVAELIGHAVGSLMSEKDMSDVVIGRDGRLSGPDLIAGLTEGLRKAGRNVIDIGMVTTPMVYFGCHHLRTGCGIAVTGSHNPPEYNGFKIVVGGETLSGEALADLYSRIAEGRLPNASMPGTINQRDISENYIARIASDVQIDRRLKVVVDAGNGVAGDIGPRVLEAIGAEVTPLNCEIDGTFPNHHPDPSDPENLVDLMQVVERLDADLGIAFDGDGDRLGVVTRDGENIYPDRLLMLFAADVLERNPGAVIVYDVKCTARLPSHILRHGGSPLMWKTGHSLIKAKMRETEAELAGEMSGHFFFGERWYGFDDGVYAAARLLEILAASPESPGEQLDALPNGVSTPEIKVDAPGEDPHAFVERFLASARFEGARNSTIDGLRVDWPDGWGLVRASNTMPVLVMRFDADSHGALERIQTAFREQLLALDPDLELPF